MGKKRGYGDSKDHTQSSNKRHRLGTVILPAPNISPSDRKSYRHIVLPNGLRAILITDPLLQINPSWSNRNLESKSYRCIQKQKPVHDKYTSFVSAWDANLHSRRAKYNIPIEERSALCLFVNVGNGDDPLECQGLAHFMEHMIFMGSKKHPEEGKLFNYVLNRGSDINAYTDFDVTAYHVAINPDFLERAMDMLASAIHEPLFDKMRTKNEVQAVDNESRFSIFSSSQDNFFDILKAISKKNHPYGKFACGNIETLKGSGSNQLLRRKLVSFHKKYYVANKMTLAVQSTETLDDLQNFVEKSFSSIPRAQNKESNNKHSDPFCDSKFCKLYKAQGERSIFLAWRLGPNVWREKSRPLNVLEALIGDWSHGTLADNLMKRGWISRMFCLSPKNESCQNQYCTVLIIYILLTSDGEKNIEKIVQTIFDYIDMLRETPLKYFEKLWQELKYCSEKDFIYGGSGEPLSNTHFVARRMMTNGSGPNFMTEQFSFEESFDHKPLFDILKSLKPVKTLFVQFVPGESKKNGLIMKHAMYKYKYTVENVPQEFITTVRDCTLEFPNENRFLTKRYSVRCNTETIVIAQVPELLVVLLGYKISPRCATPKCRYVLQFVFTKGYETVLGQQLLLLLVCEMESKMQEEITLASRAGIKTKFGIQFPMIQLQLIGFPEKMLHLLKKFCQILNGNELSSNFTVAKECVQNLYFMYLKNPIKLMWIAEIALIFVDQESILETPNKMDNVSKEDFEMFFKLLKSSMIIICTLEGNVSEQEAVEVRGTLGSINYTLHPTEPLPKRPPLLIFPTGERTLRVKAVPSQDCNNIIRNMYQITDHSEENLKLCWFITNLMDGPVMQVLRARQQLGYAVYVTPPSQIPVNFTITVICPNSKHTVCCINSKIDAFLRIFYEEFLMNMKEEEFRDCQIKVPFTFKNHVSLKFVQDWYKTNIYDSVPVRKDGRSKGQGDSNKFNKLRKISVQVIGSKNDKDTKKCHCSLCSSLIFKPSGNPLIEFAKHKNPDSETAKKYKVIDSVKKFHNEASRL